MKSLLASVGKHGKNIPNDVELIQGLLNQNLDKLPGIKKLKVDGKAGDKTIIAIEAYQQHVVKLRKTDGRIDPTGKTIALLLGDTSTNPSTTALKDQWAGDSSKWTQKKKLLSLNLDFKPKVVKLINNLKERGFQPKIYYAWRSVEVQLTLYAAKRSKVKFSFHNATYKSGIPNALAVDIIDLRYAWKKSPETEKFWKALDEEAKKLDLIWGGDWKSFKDKAHVQMHKNSKLASIKKESGH